jgi:hypothetical protein
MTTVTTSKGSYIFVPIPDGVDYTNVYGKKDSTGYYTFLCTTDTITEEIASKICERDKWGFIKDYTDNFETCRSYYDSFITLLKSHNLDNNKTYAICKKN